MCVCVCIYIYIGLTLTVGACYFKHAFGPALPYWIVVVIIFFWVGGCVGIGEKAYPSYWIVVVFLLFCVQVGALGLATGAWLLWRVPDLLVFSPLNSVGGCVSIGDLDWTPYWIYCVPLLLCCIGGCVGIDDRGVVTLTLILLVNPSIIPSAVLFLGLTRGEIWDRNRPSLFNGRWVRRDWRQGRGHSDAAAGRWTSSARLLGHLTVSGI